MCACPDVAGLGPRRPARAIPNASRGWGPAARGAQPECPLRTELARYLVKRLGFAVLMLIGVSLILFGILRLAPGGPEAVLIGGEFSEEAAAQIRQRLGLDRPILLQYATWAAAAVRGDLGRSFKTGDPVGTLVVDRLGPTLQLTGSALVF